MLQPITPPPTITTWARLGTVPPLVTGSVATICLLLGARPARRCPGRNGVAA